MSYGVGHPIVAGDTVYVHGTRSVRQAYRDWPLLLFGGTSPEEAEVEDLVADRRVRRIVGHSLGATWALKAARKHHLQYVGLGRPGLHAVRGDVSNLLDPVSFLQLRPTRVAVGHSLGAYSP